MIRTRPERASRPRRTSRWLDPGVLLLVLLTVHMVAQHLLVAGGLRTYDQVIAWLSTDRSAPARARTAPFGHQALTGGREAGEFT